MLAIQYRKSPLRYLLVRLLGKRIPKLCAGWWAPTSLVEIAEPNLPADDWVKVHPRLAGICGSDIDVIAARGSFYFAPLTSYPFILGHEVVGDVVEVGDAVTKVNVGDRVVLEPALSCPVRGITPPCKYCQRGQFGNCERIVDGNISPGVQTGYCRDTGGAWSELFVAHEHQLHRVPDDLPDEIAILAEPFACALHAALRIRLTPSDKILVIGCGTMGLMTIKALRMLGFDGHITAVAKYPHQRDWAQRMGASVVAKVGRRLYDELRAIADARIFKAELGKPTVIGGYEITFDCVASSATLDDALRWTRPRGLVMVVGMPGVPCGVDWTPIWHKELRVFGSYTYGIERWNGESIHTIELSLQMLNAHRDEFDGMLTHCYRLTQYREAFRVAMHAGQHGAIKVAFDLR